MSSYTILLACAVLLCATAAFGSVSKPGLIRIHAKDFIQGSAEASAKRSMHEGLSFNVHGVRHHDEKESDIQFMLKKHMSQPRVYVNGVEATSLGPQANVYTGHVANDPKSIVVVTVSEGALFKGMVHWSSGEHHHIAFTDTLELRELKGNEHDEVVDHSCTTDSHTHLPEPDLSRFHPTGKRAVQSNGLSSTNGKTYSLKGAFETDSSFRNKFDSDAETRDYMMTIIGVVSAMYERDFFATIDVVQLGISSFGAGSASSMKSYVERTFPNLELNFGVALRGGRAGGFAQRVGALCDQYKYCQAGISGTYGSDEFDAIHDPYIIAHEVGHLLGSQHTHDTDQFSPVIDSCGNGGQVPPDAGVCMSYCVVGSGPLNKPPCWSYCQLALVMGEVGKHGFQSERVNQVIRAHIEDSESCANLAFTTGGATPPPPTPAPTDPPTEAAVSAPPNVVTAAPTDPPTPVPPHILFDQRQNCLTNQFPAQYFPDFNGGGDAADDFVVPNNIKWRIKTVTIEGRFEPQNTNINIDSVSVIIYRDGGGRPGSIACKEEDAQVLAPDTSDEMALFLPEDDCVLTPGRYWVQVLPYVSYGNAGNQFWWRESSSNFGHKFHWQDTQNIFVSKITPCRTWTQGDQCYFAPGHDLCFSLFGVTSEDTALRPARSPAARLAGIGIAFFVALFALF